MKKKDADYLEEAFYKQRALDYLLFADVLDKLPPCIDLWSMFFEDFTKKDAK